MIKTPNNTGLKRQIIPVCVVSHILNAAQRSLCENPLVIVLWLQVYSYTKEESSNKHVLGNNLHETYQRFLKL